jgi:hypothetical protein
MVADGLDTAYPFEELAAIHALRGETHDALEACEKAYSMGWRMVWLTRLNPAFDGIRQEPAFQSLVDRMSADLERMRALPKNSSSSATRRYPFYARCHRRLSGRPTANGLSLPPGGTGPATGLPDTHGFSGNKKRSRQEREGTIRCAPTTLAYMRNSDPCRRCMCGPRVVRP